MQKATRVRGRRVAYVASEDLAKQSAKLPANRSRALLVHALVSALGILLPSTVEEEASRTPLGSTIRIVRPGRATRRDLCMFHDDVYVDRLLYTNSETPREGDEEFGLEDDCAPFEGMREYIMSVAGATLDAVKVLMDDEADIAICWDGGRHHAHKARASGFCYVNDCVLALLALRRMTILSEPSVPRRRARVMYVDVDLHLADGVAAAFHVPSRTSPANVLTLSLHHTAPGFFPAPLVPSFSDVVEVETAKDPFTLGASLRPGASAQTYARIWIAGVEKVAQAFAPDVLIMQCGTDALAGDPCRIGNWCIGDEGGMGWCVDRAVEWGCKVLLLGGGGYHSANAARAWAYLTSIAKGAPLPLDTPIPDHTAFPMYAPSFTLDVTAGAARDENDSAHIDAIIVAFERAAERIRGMTQSTR